MAFELSLFSNNLIQKQSVNEIMKCNRSTMKFGLVLTETQALALVETRSFALKENGRIEFGGGVIDKMIRAFCDSPYIDMRNYEKIMHELLEIFYYYKNETFDRMSDEELIEFMKKEFDGVCQGSLSLLATRQLDQLARSLRGGYIEEEPDTDCEEDEDGES